MSNTSRHIVTAFGSRLSESRLPGPRLSGFGLPPSGRRARSLKKQSGLNLVELMIAITIGFFRTMCDKPVLIT